jgi:hypothetical protein
MTAELTAAIQATPKAHLTFITTLDGRPRAKSSLSAEFRAWVAEAGLPPHCHLHGLKNGLKKSALRRLAEDGATGHELMAISGHRTLSEVQRYADAADKVRLADSATALWSDPALAGANEPTIVPSSIAARVQGFRYLRATIG